MTERRSGRLSVRLSPTTERMMGELIVHFKGDLGLEFSLSDIVAVCVKECHDRHVARPRDRAVPTVPDDPHDGADGFEE